MPGTSTDHLDRIRSKPIVELTPEEFDLLTEIEQHHVIRFMAHTTCPFWSEVARRERAVRS